jgi:hypothetical protein
MKVELKSDQGIVRKREITQLEQKIAAIRAQAGGNPGLLAAIDDLAEDLAKLDARRKLFHQKGRPTSSASTQRQKRSRMASPRRR